MFVQSAFFFILFFCSFHWREESVLIFWTLTSINKYTPKLAFSVSFTLNEGEEIDGQSITWWKRRHHLTLGFITSDRYYKTCVYPKRWWCMYISLIFVRFDDKLKWISFICIMCRYHLPFLLFISNDVTFGCL